MAWGLGGSAIGLWAFLSEHFERKSHNRQMTDLREKLIRQDGLLQGIGFMTSGTLQLLTKEKEQRPKDTKGVLESAISQISQLESKISRYEATCGSH